MGAFAPLIKKPAPKPSLAQRKADAAPKPRQQEANTSRSRELLPSRERRLVRRRRSSGPGRRPRRRLSARSRANTQAPASRSSRRHHDQRDPQYPRPGAGYSGRPGRGDSNHHRSTSCEGRRCGRGHWRLVTKPASDGSDRSDVSSHERERHSRAGLPANTGCQEYGRPASVNRSQSRCRSAGARFVQCFWQSATRYSGGARFGRGSGLRHHNACPGGACGRIPHDMGAVPDRVTLLKVGNGDYKEATARSVGNRDWSSVH
jgi:hypothetical protein